MTDTASPLLHVSVSPHIRENESVPSIMLWVMLALAPALAASVIFFGVRALLLTAVCMTAAVATEGLLCLLFRKPVTVGDLSAIVTGMLLAFSVPPGFPFWMGAVGSIFAIAVVKMAFGGLGRNIVNPALAARAFLAVSFPAAMSSWIVPAHGTLYGMAKGLDGLTAATPLVYFKSAMASGNFHPLDLQDAIVSLFWGNVGGCLGATSAAAICAGAILLFYKGIIRFRISFSFIGSVFILFWLFNGTGDLLSSEALLVPLYQVLGGGMMLGAFFMASDPVTSPMTSWGKIIYGIGCGILTFLIRKFGGYPDGVCYAILLMNLIVPILDKYHKPRHFGALLKTASRILRLYAGANTRKINSVLPRVNCGACDYPSCREFAKAVAEGKAGSTGCIPGGSKTAHAVGDILGASVTLPEPLMAAVHCKGGERESSQRASYDGIRDCHAAVLAGNGPKTCSNGCLGLGSCVAACRFGAIAVSDDNIAVVDPELCTGCGMCVKACPRSVIELIPRAHKIYLACSNHDRGSAVKSYCSVGCTACMLCVKTTPSGAITMGDNLPVLDYTLGENFVVAAYTCPSGCFFDLVKFRPKVNIDVKCDGCGECVACCPTAAITGEKGMRHFVNKKKCIGCGLCLNKCPVHAIAMWGGLGYAEDTRKRVFRT